MDPPTDDRFAAQLEHARSCFRRAAALSDPVIELVEVSFDAHTLPGYFVSAGTMSAPAKTLVVVGGGDTYGEDLYGYIGPAATSRGYNLFVVDLPGQGDLPSHGLVMRPDAEAPIGAAPDFVTRRADVDDTRIALFGARSRRLPCSTGGSVRSQSGGVRRVQSHPRAHCDLG